MTSTSDLGPELRGHGLGLRVPRGWDGRIFRRAEQGPRVPTRPPGLDAAASAPESSTEAVAASGTTRAIAHVANFPLPDGMGDYGSGAVETMRAGDVLVCLLEFDPEAAETALFAREGLPHLRAASFSRASMHRPLQGQGGAQTFFQVNGRPFCLYVVLGTLADRTRVLPLIQAALATLHVDAA